MGRRLKNVVQDEPVEVLPWCGMKFSNHTGGKGEEEHTCAGEAGKNEGKAFPTSKHDIFRGLCLSQMNTK